MGWIYRCLGRMGKRQVICKNNIKYINFYICLFYIITTSNYLTCYLYINLIEIIL